MGRDKALLLREGTTLLARTAAIAGKATDAAAVFVVGRERPPDWSETDETVFLTDDHPGDGPLAAIATALAHAETIGCDGIAALPCDLPLLTADALRWLVGQAETTEPNPVNGLAVVGDDDRVEPLFSVYATRCRETIGVQLAEGRRSPTALIEQGNFRRVVAPDFVRAAITDVDTREDWEALTGDFAARTGPFKAWQ